jgi:hypothetical protein
VSQRLQAYAWRTSRTAWLACSLLVTGKSDLHMNGNYGTKTPKSMHEWKTTDIETGSCSDCKSGRQPQAHNDKDYRNLDSQNSPSREHLAIRVDLAARLHCSGSTGVGLRTPLYCLPTLGRGAGSGQSGCSRRFPNPATRPVADWVSHP